MKTYDLKLKGFVGGWDFDSDYVSYVLNKCKDKPVAVLIDSLGGNVSTALSITSMFKDHGNVEVHYIGMNASAATIASMGAAKVTMDKNAMYLVHKSSQILFEWSQMNADQILEHIKQLEKTATDLQKIDANIADLYTDRCKRKGKTCAEVMNLMSVGGWLTAQEALDWGFIDEITDIDESQEAKLDEVQMSYMAKEGIPFPELNGDANRDTFLRKAMAALQTALGLPEVQPVAEATAEAAQQTNNSQPMKKIFTCIALAIACAVEEFTANAEGFFTLDEKQMDSLEAALKTASEEKETQAAAMKELQDKVTALEGTIAEKDATIAEKDAAIEALNKKPAEDPAAVVDEGHKGDAELSPADQFIQARENAREMFNILKS